LNSPEEAPRAPKSSLLMSRPAALGQAGFGARLGWEAVHTSSS
jgi:hypothetical protein